MRNDFDWAAVAISVAARNAAERQKLAELNNLKTKAEEYSTLANATKGQEKEKYLALAELYTDKYNKEVKAYNEAIEKQKQSDLIWGVVGIIAAIIILIVILVMLSNSN